MKPTRIVALAAILAAGISAPALADWTNIGSVHFDHGLDTNSAYSNFAGPVDSLELTARGSDIDCRYVRATFRNGNTRDIFTGRLSQGRSRDIDLPGDVRQVVRLNFLCRTYENGGGNIDIAANLGEYRDQWRRDPRWAQQLGGLLMPPRDERGPDRNWDNPDRWVYLGTQRFEGDRDRASNFTGWGGRNVTEIGLRPMNTDARCARVEVWFGNGDHTRLAINGGDRMDQHRIYRLDLPGTVRTITRINMMCHADGPGAVNIEVYAAK